jgi:transcription antitermination factor NusG
MSLGSCDISGVNRRQELANQNPWYVLLVKPKHEKRVAEALGGKGYEAFLPLFLARRRWLSASREVSLPLFPHYVFCRMDPERRLPILQIPGVRAIVSFGRSPIPVDESEIQSVRAMVGSGLPITPHHFLQAGALVRVTAGPLTGVEGILESVRGQDRLVVSVALLQRSVSVEIRSQHVMRAPKQVVSIPRQAGQMAAVST